MKTISLLKGIFAAAILCICLQTVSFAQTANPDPDDFIPVEVNPGVDMQAIGKLIVYPEEAKRSNIQGKSVIQVLLNSEGKPINPLY